MDVRAPAIRRAVVPAQSAGQVGAALRASLAPGPDDVVLVFVSAGLDPAAVAPALAAALAPARVVGCTSSRELSGATVDGTAVGIVLGGAGLRVGVGVADRLTGGPLAAGRAAMIAAADGLGLPVDALRRDRHVAVTLVDGRSMLAEGFCLGSAAAAPRIGMVGGMASDQGQPDAVAAVFADGRCLRDAGLVLVLETRRRFAVMLSEHMVPTPRRVVVTGADPARRRLTELDGYPAAARYLAHLRELGADGPADHQLIAEYPFAMYVDGRPYVRSLRALHGDVIELAAAVDEGTVLQIMRPSDLVARTAATLDDARRRVGELELVLAFSCAARNHEAERKHTRDALDRTYATAPVVGFDSFGEQFGPVLVNHSLAALVIGADEGPR